MTKYKTDEERLEARRATARRHYEKNKDDPEYRAKRKEAGIRYYENNREKVAEKAMNYYHVNKEYRDKKLEQVKQRFLDPEYKEQHNIRCKQRYWEKRAKFLEFEKMLLEKGMIEVEFK